MSTAWAASREPIRWMFSAETAAELTADGLDMSAVTHNGDNDDTTTSGLNSMLPPRRRDCLGLPDAASAPANTSSKKSSTKPKKASSGQQSSVDRVLNERSCGDETAIGRFGYACYVENQLP